MDFDKKKVYKELCKKYKIEEFIEENAVVVLNGKYGIVNIKENSLSLPNMNLSILLMMALQKSKRTAVSGD